MFEITEKELRRGSFEKAYNEGYLLFLDNVFPKEYIKRVEGKFNSIIYYGRLLENNKPMSVFVEVSREDRISSYYCSCSEVGHYVGGMCKHLMAFCFSIIKYYQNANNLSVDSNALKEIEESIKRVENERKIKAMEFKRQVQIEKNKKEFQELLNMYKDEGEEILLREKVRLIPCININTKTRSSLPDTMSFRIGIDKTYIVKNVQELIGNVENENYYSYGKKLSFKHKLENFDEPSQKLLKMLIVSSNLSYAMITTFRELDVSKELLDEVFEYYKGHNIMMRLNPGDDYSEVFVNKSNYEFKIRLSNKGVLSLSNVSKEAKIIKGKKQNYLAINGAIYTISELNKDLRPVVEHLLYKGKLDVMDVLDPFISYVYPRIYEFIDVDDEFKKNHPFNTLKVDSYFDIESGVVSLDSKYLIDSVLVDENELMNYRYNSYKLDSYFKTIKELGFEEVQVSENEVKYFINNTNKVVEFLRSDLSALNTFGEVYLSEALKRTTVTKMQRGMVRIKYDVDMLSVALEEFGYSDEELYKLLNGYRTKKKFVKLSKDRIVEVDEEALGKLNDVVEELNLDAKHLTNQNRVPIYQSLKTFEDNGFFSFIIDDKIKDIINDLKGYKKKKFDLDKSVKKNLRSYQLEAFNWMKILTNYKFGGVLADDMGLGKTLEMISLIASDEEAKPSLVVCPKSLTFNWINEIKKWDNTLACQVIYGILNERKEIISGIKEDEKKIYITSYDSLRNDVELYLDKKFRFITLDEGQFIKNNEALKTKAVKSLNSEVRFVLTGTPIENSLSDLWSIFDFIMPGYLSTYKRFKDKYESNIVQENDKEMLNVLVKKITPFVLRRTKEEVLKDLPEKFETVHYAFMQDEQRKVYESYLLKVRDEIKEGMNKIAILSLLTRLRQICVDPNMFIENYNGESAKIALCHDIIKEQIKSGHRMLLFSQFKSAFNSVIKELEKENIKYFILTGDTSNEERIKLVEKFNSNTDIKVFLISLKAGGTGLNLVGADTVIHLDPWWNVSAQNQATDRAHRIGQVNTVNVIKLIVADSIEQKVLELQEKKKDLVDKVISQNDEKIVKLDTSDIQYLLS